MVNEKQRWEGSIVDGVFRLHQFLGEGDRGVVFRTDFSRRRAIIKLIPDDGSRGDAQLAAWQYAATLNHPHLARILGSGRTIVEGTPVLYIVSEDAEETMADVLAERVLAPTEARDVLVTALDALGYLHAQGLAHGHVKASNFLAVGEDLKLSSDGIEAEDPGEDVRMLGVLFERALAKPLPQPFLDITRHAQDPDPAARWTIPEIATRLDGRMPDRTPAPKPHVWRFVLPAAAILIAAITFLIARSAHSGRPAPAPAPVVAQTAPSPPVPAPKAEPESAPPKPETARERKRRLRAQRAAAKAAASTGKTESGPVASTVAGNGTGPLPNVPAYAVRTIRGKVDIPVRVEVDAAGQVINAKLAAHPGSPYFAGFALKAAEQWKFTPSGAPETWVLRFEFTRQDTKVTSARVKQ